MVRGFCGRAALLAMCGTLLAGGKALANSVDDPFTYSSSSVTQPDGGATISFSGVSGSGGYASYGDDIALQGIQISDTGAPGNLGSIDIPFSFTIVQDGFSQTVTDTATIDFTRLDSGGEISTLVSLDAPAVTVGGTIFNVIDPSYAQPTINASGYGHLSVELLATPNPNDAASTPLPKSAAAGTALIGALALASRKRGAAMA